MQAECFDDELRGIAPAFRHYIQHVWKELEFGLYKGKVEVSRSSRDEESDQFSLVLPYCGKQLKWDVLFDQSEPRLAPDFRFDDDTFLASADAALLEERVPALHAWDAADPRALSQALAQLIALYRHHQKKLLNEDENSRASFEYAALVGAGSERDVEVWVGHAHAVQFLIRLHIDTQHLPELFTEGWEQNPGGECALLLVRFPPAPPELVLSPLVARAVGPAPPPHWDPATPLIDYVPLLTALLNDKIKACVRGARLTRGLVSALVVRHEGALLEHDARSAAFLLHVDHFHFILHVQVSSESPDAAPVLTLRSVYHSARGKPRVKTLAGCPLDRLHHYIRDQVELFKRECTEHLHNTDTRD